jgi:hypothetical protein
MVHKGVEYSITRTELPAIWKWQFRIGDQIKSGKTEARLTLLAMHRVQLRIDPELKHSAGSDQHLECTVSECIVSAAARLTC